MTDRQKPKSARDRQTNDGRKNGKAFKKGFRRSSKPVPQTELQKALMGKGAMVRIMKPLPGTIDPRTGKVTEASGVH